MQTQNSTKLNGDEFVREYALNAIATFDALTEKYRESRALGMSPDGIAEMCRNRWSYLTRGIESATEQITNEYQTETNKKAIAAARKRYETAKAKALGESMAPDAGEESPADPTPNTEMFDTSTLTPIERGTHSDDCGELTDGYCWSCNRHRVTNEVYHGSQLVAFSRGGERFVSEWINFPAKMHTPIDNAIQEQRLACRPALMSTDFVPYDGRQFLRYVPRA